MNRPDHTTYREWVNLEADGRLPRDERARLEEHLATCSACQSELDGLRELEGFLLQARVPVRNRFRDDVLTALPAAGWEARAPRTWGFPAAMFVLLGVIAAAVIGSGTAAGEHAGLGALSAVFGMFQATVLAGSGLLAASWKGFGLVFEEVLSSPVSLGMFGVLVLCLNLLLVSMIRRKRATPAEARSLNDTRR
ncbi:MAG TPA: zf-HC2 domain-containing protein [Thermoanaerobaculia bacterium]|nr:zf-HC2 domain-containing protein [Thermoanaerobaculia bacterium]